MKTIKDAEEQVQSMVSDVLRRLGLLPTGYEPSVRFYGASKKKKQTAILQKNWHVNSDSIKIKFKTVVAPAGAQPQPASSLQPQRDAAAPSDDLSDLIRALARAEARPGYKFVALKWFRDTALVAEGFPWANSDTSRKSILTDGIDRKLILTSAVANPNSPYPTTAIRLNRLMPQVQAILGIQNGGAKDFSPVAIRGESLSTTVLNDRR